MNLDARIFFKASYRIDGGAVHSSTFYEPIETVIPELAISDAPVATLIDGRPATRWYDGRHFAEFPNPDGLTLPDIREILEWNPLWGMSNGYECFRHESRSSQYPPRNATSFDEEARSVALEMATTCFDKVVMIDGTFWIECAEPYLYAETPEHQREPSFCFPSTQHAERPNHRSHSWLFHSRVFRADAPIAAHRIAVLIPESIRRHPERDTILDAAKFLIEDYSYTYLAKTHPDVLSALTRVHHAVYGMDADRIDCDTLGDRINAMLTAMELRENDHRLGDRTRLSGYRRCVDRWADRDVSISNILPHTPSSGPRL